MNGVFITGSNTEVGKTTVAVEIIKRLSEKRHVKVRKPVETNCELVEWKLCPKRRYRAQQRHAAQTRLLNDSLP